jgi:hypothetical protein
MLLTSIDLYFHSSLAFTYAYKQTLCRVGFEIEENDINLIINLTPFQFAPFTGCNDFHEEADSENGDTPQGANIRGISIAAARCVLGVYIVT